MSSKKKTQKDPIAVTSFKDANGTLHATLEAGRKANRRIALLGAINDAATYGQLGVDTVMENIEHWCDILRGEED